MISEEDNVKTSQKNLYSKLLSISKRHLYFDDYESYYQNLPETLILLRQIYQQSKSEQGRTKIWQIQKMIIRYWLIDPLRITWTKSEYWEVDNLCLKIIANLAIDPRFSEEAIGIRPALVDLDKQVNSSEFKSLCLKAIQNIDEAKQKMKQAETQPAIKYKQNFANKEQAIEQLGKHDNFYNFAGRSVFFQEEYDQYIGMLSGALKVGAKDSVTNIFPKGCFGCVLFSMVITGCKTGKKQLAVEFLKQYTTGWFTEAFYDILLDSIKTLYRTIRTNQRFSDRYELVCLRLNQSKQTKSVYELLQKLAMKDRLGQLSKFPKIINRMVFQNIQRMIRNEQMKKQECLNVRRNFFKTSQQSKQKFDISKILLEKAQRQYLVQIINKNLAQIDIQMKQVYLSYVHKKQLCKYQFKEFIDNPKYAVILIKLKNGHILGGFFIAPSSNSKAIGSAIFIDTKNRVSLEIKELQYGVKIFRTDGQTKEKNKQEISEKENQIHQLRFLFDGSLFKINFYGESSKVQKFNNQQLINFLKKISQGEQNIKQNVCFQIQGFEVYQLKCKCINK